MTTSGTDGETLDTDARPTDLLALVGDPYFYFVTLDTGELRRVARAGGAEEVLGFGSPQGMQIAGNDDFVFFTSFEGGHVRRWDRASESVVTIADAQPNPAGITVHGDRVYWVNAGSETASVMSSALDGSDARILASTPEPFRVTTDGDNIYFSSVDTVWRVGNDGGEKLALGTGYMYPGAVSVDERFVFWAELATGRVVKSAK